jgi:signal peptidase I
MLVTAILILTFLVLTALSLYLWAIFLRLGARWARIEGATLRRCVAVAVALLMVHFALLYSVTLVRFPDDLPAALFCAIGFVLLMLALEWLVIAAVLRARFWRAAQAWLPTLAATAAIWLFGEFVFKPFVAEAFQCPTNAMAPTLLGRHCRTPCPVCGEPAYCSPIVPRFGPPPEGETVICGSFHTSRVRQVGNEVYSPDRFLVAKFLEPRRWDMIVFRYPEDPTTNFVKRLVGLPGEEVVIKDGSVWIDGEKLVPPEELRGIEYVSQFDEPFMADLRLSGTRENPAKLGPGEYFVLGDFSKRSKDSRLWLEGAPGHPPYAVPTSHIIGVVTQIYWPPSRWRAFR